MTQDRKLKQAVAAFQAGDVAGAEKLAREILQRAPRNPTALHLFGVARLQQGDAMGAREFLQRAVDVDPGNLLAVGDLGVAQLHAGDPVAAEASFRRMLERRPAAHTYSSLGLALCAQERHAEAVAPFRSATELQPADAGLWLNLGNALHAAGDHAAAETALERALRINPALPEALNSLGTVLQAQGRFDGARGAFSRALGLRANYAEALGNLGRLLIDLDPAEAEAVLERAVTAAPGDAGLQFDLGTALQQQGRHDSAVAVYRRALSLAPGDIELRHNLGHALMETGHTAEAEATLRDVVAREPAHVRAWSNLGVLLHEQGRLPEAQEVHERALALDPEYADARYNAGLTYLCLHRFAEAWPYYAARTQCKMLHRQVRKQMESVALFGTRPLWQGPARERDASVAVWAEQGIGDQILFSTLLPELIESGVRFIYEVDGRLLDAYRRAFPSQQFVPLQDPPVPELMQTERVVWAGSLPQFLRRDATDFVRQPAALLAARTDRVEHIRAGLPQGASCRIGLSWRSSRGDRVGPRKTTALEALLPLLQHPDVSWIDLQYGDTLAERDALQRRHGIALHHFDEVDYFHDLEGLLAILSVCDLVITASNATAHLAGALGRPVWLLLPGGLATFHYWAAGESGKVLWYPTVRVIGSHDTPGWPDLAAKARIELDAFLQTKVKP